MGLSTLDARCSFFAQNPVKDDTSNTQIRARAQSLRAAPTAPVTTGDKTDSAPRQRSKSLSSPVMGRRTFHLGR